MCLLGVQVRAAVLTFFCTEITLCGLAQTGCIISIDQMNEIYTVQDFYNLSEVFSLHQGTVEDT